MIKGKAARIAGFTVALGATASLVGFAATGTGAYFSDAKSGAANVSTGSVEVHTSNINGLDFTNLLPGQLKTQDVDYASNGTGPEDIYLAFDDPNGGDDALNAPTRSGPTPLGRFGHLEVDGSQGSFQSSNLAANPDGTTASTCNINSDGLGGSDQQATDSSTILPFCPAPKYILLQSNLQPGQGGSAKITFGFTKLLQNGQNSAVSQIPFRVVAEQAGVTPTDPNTNNQQSH